MTPFVFDTLSASKQLREAGMPEGVAEAVVSVFQHAAAMPDISHLATKADLEASSAASRADFQALKADIAELSTKIELEQHRSETKAEFSLLGAEIRADFATLRAEINDKLRQHTWTMLGGFAVLLTISTAVGRLIG